MCYSLDASLFHELPYAASRCGSLRSPFTKNPVTSRHRAIGYKKQNDMRRGPKNQPSQTPPLLKIL